MAHLQDVSLFFQKVHRLLMAVSRWCGAQPSASLLPLQALGSWQRALESQGNGGGGGIGPPPCRSSHLPCSFLIQCLEPGPRRRVLLSSLPLLLCFSLFWVYCQEAGAVGSQCLRWTDNRVLRLPCWGAGQPLGAAPLPPSSGRPLLARGGAFGFAQFLESQLSSRGRAASRAGVSTGPVHSVSLPEFRDTFWVTSWTLSPDLATESFLSAVMVLVSKNPLGSFIKSCYFTDTKVFSL